MEYHFIVPEKLQNLLKMVVSKMNFSFRKIFLMNFQNQVFLKPAI